MKLLGPYRIWAILSVLALVMLLTAGVASADNKWNGYHWPSDNLSPTVVDNTGEPTIFNVRAAVEEWALLNTPIQPKLDSPGVVEVVVTKMRPHYLGVARIWVDEFDHIGKGRVELNERYLNSLSLAEWDHVLCQELGHIWAMAHSDVVDDPSCMRGSDVLGSHTSPSDHDKVTLTGIYPTDHSDTSPPDDGGSSGGGDCDRNPAGKCRGSSNSSSGRWVTIHEFLAP